MLLLLVYLMMLMPGAGVRADDGMRCGQWLITVGRHEYEVAIKCGPPTAADRYETSRRGRSITVDLWTYDRGPRDFIRTLRFEDGVLRDVDVGGYGHLAAQPSPTLGAPTR
jgi:hypothetical protein